MEPEAEPIYLQDLIDPRRKISLEYFRPLMLLFAVAPFFIAIVLPAVFIVGAGDDDGSLIPVEDTRAFAYVGYWIFGTGLAYSLIVVCINRLRATGHRLWLLLVPGYNLYLLFFAPDEG